MNKLLVINPGSTSTKLAIYEDDQELWSETLRHSTEELSKYEKMNEQLNWRKDLVLEAAEKAGFKLQDFKAVVARGGAGLDPISGGTYLVDSLMVEDLYNGKNAEHASNLAGIIAYQLAEEYHFEAYTVDPVAVDEFEPVARLSGLPELPRRCQSHALNLKAVARKIAEDLNNKMKEINLIGVHLGGGISVAVLKKGKIVDVNNANQGGPFSPERVGTLPAIDLVEYIYREQPDKDDFKKRLVGKGGLAAYLGSNDAVEIEKRIAAGDKKAEQVYQAMIYQISKEIGQMAAVLSGDVQGIFLTGGMANSEYITDRVKELVSFIAPVKVYPGAEEMKHLAAGALRVINNEEEAKKYDLERKKLAQANQEV